MNSLRLISFAADPAKTFFCRLKNWIVISAIKRTINAILIIFFKISLNPYYCAVKISPVIFAGIGICIIDKIVGAISASFPFFTGPLQSLSIIKKGTRFKV